MNLNVLSRNLLSILFTNIEIKCKLSFFEEYNFSNIQVYKMQKKN